MTDEFNSVTRRDFMATTGKISAGVFAAGALRAAQYLVGQAPGRYTMSDLLGF